VVVNVPVVVVIHEVVGSVSVVEVTEVVGSEKVGVQVVVTEDVKEPPEVPVVVETEEVVGVVRVDDVETSQAKDIPTINNRKTPIRSRFMEILE